MRSILLAYKKLTKSKQVARKAGKSIKTAVILRAKINATPVDSSIWELEVLRNRGISYRFEIVATDYAGNRFKEALKVGLKG